MEHLKGFNVANRYLILLYYNPTRMNKKKVSICTLDIVQGDREYRMPLQVCQHCMRLHISRAFCVLLCCVLLTPSR